MLWVTDIINGISVITFKFINTFVHINMVACFWAHLMYTRPIFSSLFDVNDNIIAMFESSFTF